MGYYCVVFPAVRECNDYRTTYGADGGSAANCVLPLVTGIVGWVAVLVVRGD
ncbi:hypothetical protein CC85DRAFT_287922 [Cutaneotrichosporon oleaginosum]|uniref:Uncharacterized protein n=1 Tax=Cutaneotrichosporon oleaginosum TaxID=879819 RepID=A0A0J0XG39_9TREE|nr:uncharacterized protein CC85DRAFT_287922 [Cutaneotrichosporon oleaginosum]KLT40040.1 hypothetical protein CC85DRAFT_287922 [Cutaneotrichosporon oleaginosum]TXT13817.1 hypothetical protein COLE_00010 [Cutaneotrichosporon oleaginosum]